MTCRTCGTEIADKAIICYRCGNATTEAQFKPASAAPRNPWRARLGVMLALLAVVAAVLVAYFLK